MLAHFESGHCKQSESVGDCIKLLQWVLEPGVLELAGVDYGLVDVVNNEWVRNEDGQPALFGDFMTARTAALVVDVRKGQDRGRTLVAPFKAQP